MKSRASILSLYFLILVNMNSIRGFESEKDQEDSRSRTARGGLIAFKPFGTDVKIGLDIELPFIKVPTKRKLNGAINNEALLTVNTAALTIGGLISGFGLLVGHVLRSLIRPWGREDSDAIKPVIETRSSTGHRSDFETEGSRFARIMEPVKLLYRNASGARMDMSLAELFNTVENAFSKNEIDLSACAQKSLCSLVQRSNINMQKGVATGIEKTIDGLLQFNWILQLSRKTAVEDAILAGRSNSTEECSYKNPSCQWEAPDEKLYEFFKNNVKFI